MELKKQDHFPNNIAITCLSTTIQLMDQLINEIKKTKFSKDISAVPLISRKGMCVNESVKDI